ncbi:hypothetical protein ES703_61984 [subsurface metagenome]
MVAAYRKGRTSPAAQALPHLKVLATMSHLVSVRTPTRRPQSFNQGLLIVRPILSPLVPGLRLVFADLVAVIK